MKIWSRIVGGIYIIMGIIFVFCLLSFFANKELCQGFLNFIEKKSINVGFFSIGVLFVGIIWIVNWIDYVYRTKAVSFDNPGGKVKISLKAIEDYISSTIIKNIEGIEGIKVKAFVTSRGLETKVNLKIVSKLSITETCSTIQELIKRYLQDTIGIERIANI
ncbi:MAG: alkaline shock response membrane anchor protein AmaP, partial [Candidatus Omnitrophica bacterium]|nr:alkaline shock response membrane anchor protein AmaP [Candidatus Omnitrophota bacterium]